MRQALANLRSALERAGARLEDVVRTRMYVRDIEQWEAIGREHGDGVRLDPAGVDDGGGQRLVDPDMLVEIEADAYIAGAAA